MITDQSLMYDTITRFLAFFSEIPSRRLYTVWESPSRWTFPQLLAQDGGPAFRLPLRTLWTSQGHAAGHQSSRHGDIRTSAGMYFSFVLHLLIIYFLVTKYYSYFCPVISRYWCASYSTWLYFILIHNIQYLVSCGSCLLFACVQLTGIVDGCIFIMLIYSLYIFNAINWSPSWHRWVNEG